MLPYQESDWHVMKHPGKEVNFEDNDDKQRISSKSFPLHIIPQTQYTVQHLNKKTNETMELLKFSNFLLLPRKFTIFFHHGGGGFDVKKKIFFLRFEMRFLSTDEAHKVNQL